jgi:hypothetical protein
MKNRRLHFSNRNKITSLPFSLFNIPISARGVNCG